MFDNLQITANTEATITEEMAMIREDRGRGFASAKEAWAELKENLEALTNAEKTANKVHKELWDAITRHESDAVTVLMQEMERDARQIAVGWEIVAALAKLALVSADE